ncbi:hypothetical protein B0H14DRAFT_2630597 [Mycena olivaceomarginata]|nr:hypothetical protein B0H14DRAFT_2630597 [Mycena olivaceomarginata]
MTETNLLSCLEELECVIALETQLWNITELSAKRSIDTVLENDIDSVEIPRGFDGGGKELLAGPSFMQCLQQMPLEHPGFRRVDWHPSVGQVCRLDREGGFARDGGEAIVGDELAVVASAEVVGVQRVEISIGGDKGHGGTEVGRHKRKTGGRRKKEEEQDIHKSKLHADGIDQGIDGSTIHDIPNSQIFCIQDSEASSWWTPYRPGLLSQQESSSSPGEGEGLNKRALPNITGRAVDMKGLTGSEHHLYAGKDYVTKREDLVFHYV